MMLVLFNSNTTGVTSGAGTATLPQHLSSPLDFSGVHVPGSLVFCVLWIIGCLFVLYRCVICPLSLCYLFFIVVLFVLYRCVICLLSLCYLSIIVVLFVLYHCVICPLSCYLSFIVELFVLYRCVICLL